MKKGIICSACFIICLSFGFSQNKASVVILNGLPIVKVMSDIEGTEHVQLSKEDQWNYRLEIVKKGNKYYWASRENRELHFSKSGQFYNFIEQDVAGYIRAVKTENGVLYMEHLTLGLKNITYWGLSVENSLPE